MYQLTRIGLLTLALTALATSASAVVQTISLVGPLNKAPSGRIICEAALRLGPAPEGIILTLHDRTGAVVKTQTFASVGGGEIVTIEIGPGQANAYICIAQSSSEAGVEVTLSHRNSLNQSTATVGEPRRVPPREVVSIAGPLTPGLQRKVVCKVASELASEVAILITDENNNTVATAIRNVNAMGNAEVSATAGYNKRYLCFGVATNNPNTRIQATIESVDNFGVPMDADEGSPDVSN